MNYDKSTIDYVHINWYHTVSGSLEVSGEGTIPITNTGGASSSKGGMGSGSEDDTAKGDLSKPGEKNSATKTSEEKSEEGFDPIGKNIKEKERENKDS